MDKTLIRISVRNLVEFIMRSGDLDNRRSSAADREAMLKGSRLHRKIQKRMPAEYRAEVPFQYEREYEHFIVRVEGRADGVIEGEHRVTIDEIKGVYMDLERLEEPVGVHQAQAMCYGYMYSREKLVDTIEIQMTYCNLETEQIRRFSTVWTREELEKWFDDLLSQYYQWADYQQSWRRTRNQSMQGLEFPFAYRQGQREIVTSVYRTISRNRQIFIQAPTGVGKTMSAIFPAVRAVGEGKGEKIFYLTAKTITRTVAEEGFSLLKEKGLEYKVITITAKEKLCMLNEPQCNPDSCPYAKGHFDRVNDAVYELWTTGSQYDRNALLSQAEKWQVCPFEMCLDLTTWCDAIICDYNYVFDPNVYLKRFFGEGVKGEYIFLIDEAHNLVERGRQMFSAAIYKEDVLHIKRLVKTKNAKLARYLEKVNKQLLEYKRECETYAILPSQGGVPVALMNVMGELEVFLEEEKDEELHKEVLDFYFNVRDFLNISELIDENYTVYTEMEEDGRFKMKLYCVNPAVNIQKCLDKSVGTVFFSATLLPVAYYRSLFSTREDDYAIYAPSPFDAKKRCVAIGADVSSRYTRRNYREYERIAAYIYSMIHQKEGNYMVFFPSYRMLQDVYEVFWNTYGNERLQCLLQKSSMQEQEREEFLEHFERRQGTLVGFCVMGGIFSEGIDLIGDSLIGAAIVGTGIPQISNEREILKQHYDRRGENGFDYAYRFPGMNKVLQSGGRVIRTREDTGVILLLDERFLNYEYRALLPREWEGYQKCTLPQIEGILGRFWEEAEENEN